jgi:hypothetical protein
MDEARNNSGVATMGPKQRELPIVGSVVFLRFDQFGGSMREVNFNLTNKLSNDSVREGDTLIEVEVKAIKKVKINLE